jgi:uncharacterized protein (UPF0332 family)
MGLTDEEKEGLIRLRLKRAYDTLLEAKGNIDMKFYQVAANRLYYACFYAVNALLLRNNMSAKTHDGNATLLNLHFVLTGKITREQGKLYKNLLEKRQSSDYDDWYYIDKEDVAPLLDPARQFIETLEKLIYGEKIML